MIVNTQSIQFNDGRTDTIITVALQIHIHDIVY